jgi:hypothetical protein
MLNVRGVDQQPFRARVSDNGMAPDGASEVVAVKHLLKSRHE